MAGPADEIPTLILSMLWALYNMTILGGALAVAFESRQVRSNPRVEMAMPAAIKLANGHLYPCTLSDYSNGGVGVRLDATLSLVGKERVWLLLRYGRREAAFPARVQRVFGSRLGLELEPMNKAQHIAFIQCTFARADTWSLWQKRLGSDCPLHSFSQIVQLGWGLIGVCCAPRHWRHSAFSVRSWSSGCSLLFHVAFRRISGPGSRQHRQ